MVSFIEGLALAKPARASQPCAGSPSPKHNDEANRNPTTQWKFRTTLGNNGDR